MNKTEQKLHSLKESRNSKANEMDRIDNIVSDVYMIYENLANLVYNDETEITNIIHKIFKQNKLWEKIIWKVENNDNSVIPNIHFVEYASNFPKRFKYLKEFLPIIYALYFKEFSIYTCINNGKLSLYFPDKLNKESFIDKYNLKVKS